MFDPQKLLSRTLNQLPEQNKQQILREMLEEIATFIDRHSIIVPDISIAFPGGAISISAKKLPADKIVVEKAPS